jgi:hypothetical protein
LLRSPGSESVKGGNLSRDVFVRSDGVCGPRPSSSKKLVDRHAVEPGKFENQLTARGHTDVPLELREMARVNAQRDGCFSKAELVMGAQIS